MVPARGRTPLIAAFNSRIVHLRGLIAPTKGLISLKNNSSLITIPLCAAVALSAGSGYKLVINKGAKLDAQLLPLSLIFDTPPHPPAP